MFDEIMTDSGQINARVLDELYKESLSLSHSVVEYFKVNKKENFTHLDPHALAYYTLECNRITAGIMQAMSWCLLHKGVRNGEVSKEKAATDDSRIASNDLFLKPLGCDPSLFPGEFIEYSERVRALYSRILRMDRILYEMTDAGDKNPVQEMLNKIERSADI